MTTPTDEVAMQPALPTLELPDFEGLKPVGVVTKVNGAGNRIARAMHLDDRIVLVIEAEVSNVGHASTDDGVKRVHTLRVKDLYELEGKAGLTLLRSLRQAYRIADDTRHGRKPILADLEQPDGNGAGIDVVVDDKGRIHTAPIGEGETLDGLPLVDVAVLVFEDGSRALWPDDFPGATGPHPEAGERIHRPAGKKDAEAELVRRVLDADTGETLDEWTDEQEADRLLELERELGEQEAREDREAADELLVARERHTLADRLMYAEGMARSIGSVKGNLEAITDPKVIEIALELERKDKNRAGMIHELEVRLTELEKEAGE